LVWVFVSFVVSFTFQLLIVFFPMSALLSDTIFCLLLWWE